MKIGNAIGTDWSLIGGHEVRPGDTFYSFTKPPVIWYKPWTWVWLIFRNYRKKERHVIHEVIDDTTLHIYPPPK